MFTRIVSSALILAGSTLFAQSFTPVRELKNLSPAAIEKLHALEELNALPAAEWRFHAGDLAHGESPTLDDASWPTVTAPAKAPKDAVWYRREIEVPKTLHGYDITGARIWFQFRAEANGPMPEIIYFNGRRVALGDDLEPIVLFEPAHPGDKILVAVKLLHTVDEKSFRGVTLRIEPLTNSGAPGLASETWVRPNPDDIRIQCIAAANLLPALTPARTDLLPKVEAAVAAIDTQALAAANQSTFDQSLRTAQAILTTLHPILSQAHIVEAGNSHIDAAWLWPRSETIDVVHRTFTTALQLMNEYPDYTFTQSAAQYSAWMADKYPELNDQIKQRIKEGRWEIVGGMWVEPDLNIPDGESLVRQLLIGQRYFQKEYGVAARIGWNPDSFGYNWQLPQIYKRSGLDYFVTQKMHWNDTNQLPFRLFWWQSPDGSKVLTYFPTDYVHSNVNPTRISADFAESAQRNPGTTEMLDLYGIGDHGGGPTRDMLDQADHWIALSGSNNSVILSGTPERAEGESNGAQSKDLHNTPPSQAHSSLSSTNAAAIPGGPSEGAGGFSPLNSASAEKGASALGVPATAAEGQRPDIYQPGPQAQVSGLIGTQRAEGPTYNTDAVPTLRYGTAQQYFSDVEKNLNPDSPIYNYASLAKGYTAPPTTPGKMGIPTWNDELYFEYHRGVFTSQAAHKAANRKSETATLNAEKFASMAWVLGLSQPPNLLPEQHYPADELTENWKKITFNQFHDLAAGSGIAVIYRDAQDDYKQVFETDREITNSAFDTLGAVADTRVKDGVPILVFNSSPWPRSEVVKIPATLSAQATWIQIVDEQNRLVPTSSTFNDPITNHDTVIARIPDVPAMGYTLIHARPGKTPTDERTDIKIADHDTSPTIVLSNYRLALTVDRKTGCITSLIILATNTEAIAPGSCGNQLQAFADNPKQYDAWNIDPGTLDRPPTIIPVDNVVRFDNGPVSASIRITRTWHSSKFAQIISLDTQADTVRIDTTIDWHEKHTLLKAAFPLAHSSDQATYEIPYGSITRPTTRNNSFEKAKFEVPALRWADLGDSTAGLSILNDSKYGYDAAGNTLRITLLRSPTWPDPDADQGTQHFTYALYPHTGTWKQAETVHRAYELNSPLTAQQVFSHTGTLPSTHSFASIENKNVTLTAIKKAEDSDALVFRMYEWAGTPTDVKLHVPPGATYAVESNLMEKPEGPHLPLAADTVTVPIHSYEILTLQVFYPTKTAASESPR